LNSSRSADVTSNVYKLDFDAQTVAWDGPEGVETVTFSSSLDVRSVPIVS
jgi:hypothetical protein